jgi:putative membrane protein
MNKDQLPNSPGDPRTYLAIERTFLAWIRTGVALMGFGFVVARFGLFLRELTLEKLPVKDPHAGLSLPVGITLIAVGILVTIVAAIRYHRYIQALDRGEFRRAFDTGFSFLVAGLLALIGLAVAIYLAVFL